MKRPAHPGRWVLLGLALCIALALFLLYRPRTAADVLSPHGTGLTYGEVICTSPGPTSETITCTPAQLEQLEDWFAHSTLRWFTPDGGQFQPYEKAGYVLALATADGSYTITLTDLGTFCYHGQIYHILDGLEEFLALFPPADQSA